MSFRDRTTWISRTALLLSALFLAACGREELSYSSPPRWERSHVLTDAGESLQPLRLAIHRDKLYVCYRGLARLDVYDLDLAYLGSIPLTDPEPIRPNGFAVTDSQVIVCDSEKRVIVTYDHEGRFLNSFDLMPDGETRLSPETLTQFGGIVYVADTGVKRILAVSVVDAAGVTEVGELILTVPDQGSPPLGAPSAVAVTPDGRLLVGDAEASSIRVFTCDGRAIYDFDPVPGLARLATRAIAADGLPDPSLQTDASFDPSGLRAQGRFHVLDGAAGRLHMFNPLGRYIASYPEPGILEGPTGLAIDHGSRRIYVADPDARHIDIFRYGVE